MLGRKLTTSAQDASIRSSFIRAIRKDGLDQRTALWFRDVDEGEREIETGQIVSPRVRPVLGRSLEVDEDGTSLGQEKIARVKVAVRNSGLMKSCDDLSTGSQHGGGIGFAPDQGLAQSGSLDEFADQQDFAFGRSCPSQESRRQGRVSLYGLEPSLLALPRRLAQYALHDREPCGPTRFFVEAFDDQAGPSSRSDVEDSASL
jgi:hypothetical protein